MGRRACNGGVRSGQTARQHAMVLADPEEELMARYDHRIATRISGDADIRLRLAALAQRRSLSAVLTDVLDQVLPTADELVQRLRDIGRGHVCTPVT